MLQKSIKPNFNEDVNLPLFTGKEEDYLNIRIQNLVCEKLDRVLHMSED